MFAQWGTFVTTPKINDHEASVHVSSTIVNQDSKRAAVISIQTRIIAPTGEVVARSETPNRIDRAGRVSVDVERDLTVRNPRRWDLAHPYMYQLVTTVRETARTRTLSG